MRSHDDDASRNERSIDRRIEVSARFGVKDLPELLRAVQDAVAADMSSTVQFGADIDAAVAEHRKWQLIHRYVLRTPFHSEPGAPRAQQWQGVLGRVREIGDLDLIEWVIEQADTAIAKARTEPARLAETAIPTYLLLLRHVASRKRQARAQLRWAKDADKSGWSTCTTATLGRNLIDLHAASVHSRDNPEYSGPVDGVYARG